MPADTAFARGTGGLELPGLSGRVRAIPASARIHAMLREQIIGMEIAPGSALQEKQIAHVCGVSRTPVREALLKLADERLVDIFPQYGTFVSRINVPAMRDAMVIRDALERAAARGAAKAVSDAAVTRLRNLLTEQRTTHEAGHLAAFYAADEAFHQAIAEIAGHPNLWRVVRQEKAHVDRCRILTLPSHDRRLGVMSDHEAIFEAIASGRPERAEEAMQAHLDQVLPIVSVLVQRHPDYFEGADMPPPGAELAGQLEDLPPAEPARRRGRPGNGHGEAAPETKAAGNGVAKNGGTNNGATPVRARTGAKTPYAQPAKAVPRTVSRTKTATDTTKTTRERKR